MIPVPDSGNPAARGFARASGLPQDDGLIKNRYVARTFIQPGQELRKHGLRLKFNPLPEVVAGKRIVVVDDSIVRGNTTRQIVQMLRDAGAAEVHMRISAPPIRHPCHYGIDMSTREEMIAHNRTEAEVAAELGADSLAYLSLEGVYEAIGGSRETHCDACFSGDYPLVGTSAQGRVRARAAARAQPSSGATRSLVADAVRDSCDTLRQCRVPRLAAIRLALPSPAEVLAVAADSHGRIGAARAGPAAAVPVARVARPRRGAARAVRLRRLPAGPARGGRGRARPAATCWW